MFELEEFRLWLADRFEPEELLLYLNGVTTEDVLDAFPEKWEENEQLLRLAGMWEDFNEEDIEE